MPYVPAPRKKWPKWVTLSVLLCLLAAALLLLPYPKPIRETYPCTKIAYDGEITDCGEITLDLLYKRYLVRESRLPGQILLPDGTEIAIPDGPVFDPDLGTYCLWGILFPLKTGEFNSAWILFSEDMQTWLISVGGDCYLISEQPPETAEELNDLFPGFRVWTPNI